MTVVEFFACSPIENMISCFSLNPDKVIFIGNGRRVRRRVKSYEAIAKRLGMDVVFEFKCVMQNSVNKICDALIEIVETEADCCFDLTGGNELALVAMGKVYQMYDGERHLQMQRFNIETGRIIDCDDDGELPATHMGILLNGAENVALHGGKVVQSTRLDDISFAEDIAMLWELCKRKALLWNSSINKLGELLAVSHHENSGKRAVIDKRRCSGLVNFHQKLEAVKDFVGNLCEVGMVTAVKDNAEEFSFAYKNPIVKKCLLKAGNVLELKALLLASTVRDKNGEKLYNDCLSGVVIDWDGKKDENGFEGTVNEIDLLLMRGFMPIFISCKNGGVDDSELYKLSSVAEMFGGKYAKKALIVTDFNRRGASKSYFLKRASDMGIKVIEGVNKMTDKAFAEQLSKI